MRIWLYNHLIFPIKNLFWCKYRTHEVIDGKEYYTEWLQKKGKCVDTRRYRRVPYKGN